MTYQEILQRGLQKGITELELYVKNGKGLTISLFEGELESSNTKIEFGMSLRGIFQNKMGYAYTENSTEDAIEEALNNLINNAKNITSNEKQLMFEKGAIYQDIKNPVADYLNYSNIEKIQILQNLEKRILDTNDLIKKVGYCQYREDFSKVEIINSKGLDLKRELSYSMVFVGALAEKNGETSVGFSGDMGYELNKLDYDRLVKESTDEAINSLGGTEIESGTYEVVLKRDVVADLISAFCSVFSGESAIKKLTKLTDKVNTKVFGENITIIDDPFDENAIVKVPFDDEGVPCQTKKIVDKGVFKGFLHNLATANYFNTLSTGNGFKRSVASGVYVSPINLKLEPGTYTKEEIIKSVENGLYITEISGLHAGLNPISGDFNVKSSGYVIKNGKIDHPVTLFVVSGNFYELLNKVELIGNDIEKNYLDLGMPTIKISSLQISGK